MSELDVSDIQEGKDVLIVTSAMQSEMEMMAAADATRSVLSSVISENQDQLVVRWEGYLTIAPLFAFPLARYSNTNIPSAIFSMAKVCIS